MYFSAVDMRMDDFERIRVIRQYKKSSIPRLRWTPDLHDHFVEAVRTLGGKHKATPKKIMQMMGVKGLKISHIKSHLQMYRSMRETTTSDKFITMKYQENRPNLRHFCEELRDAPFHGKVVRVPFTGQVRRATQKGINVIYHDNKGPQGSSTSEITRGSVDDREANIETRTRHEINFLGLENHQTCDQSSSSINLELTIS